MLALIIAIERGTWGEDVEAQKAELHPDHAEGTQISQTEFDDGHPSVHLSTPAPVCQIHRVPWRGPGADFIIE